MANALNSTIPHMLILEVTGSVESPNNWLPGYHLTYSHSAWVSFLPKRLDTEPTTLLIECGYVSIPPVLIAASGINMKNPRFCAHVEFPL